jgi:predicted SAM-dependent methyltransferase
MSEPIKLNLGSHGDNQEGYVNIDLFDPTADIKCDVTTLPFENESVDEVLASHILEHFRCGNAYEPHLSNPLNPKTVVEALTEWRRVLKIGGLLEIKVPDFEKIAWLFYNNPAWARSPGPDGIFPNYQYWLCSTGQHQVVFDQKSMTEVLRSVGFTKVEFIDPRPRQFVVDRSMLEMHVKAVK